MHPQTICVIKTRANSLGLQIFQGDAQKINFSEREYAGIVIQYPDTNGEIQDFSDIIAAAHSSGVRLFIVCFNIPIYHKQLELSSYI